MSACAICPRSQRGFGWVPVMYPPHDPRRLEGALWFCSRLCQLIHERNKGMIDPSKAERAAMDAATQRAGEYIESVGRADLMTWLPHQFDTLVDVIVTAYTAALRSAADDPGDEVPYP
jgi:hypothetical protein